MKRWVAFTLLVLAPVACSGPEVADTASSEGAPDSEVVSGEPARGPAEAEADEDPAREDIKVAESGFLGFQREFGDSPSASWAVLLHNPNSDHWIATDVRVNITFQRSTGEPVKTETDSVAAILPGQTVAIAPLGGSTDVAGAEAVDVQARVSSWEEADQAIGKFTASNVATRERAYGGLQTNGTLTSSFTRDLQDILATAVYRDAAGRIIGGSSTFVDFVPAGGQVGVEITSLSKIPGVASSEIYGQITNLTIFAE